MTFTHLWHWRAKRPDRKGHPCRIALLPGPGSGPRNVLVGFPDGEQLVSQRRALRRLSTPRGPEDLARLVVRDPAGWGPETVGWALHWLICLECRHPERRRPPDRQWVWWGRLLADGQRSAVEIFCDLGFRTAPQWLSKAAA